MSDRQLTRTAFSTSRLLDFASVKELTAQTGHEVGEWPLVVLKELVDNALDACEEAGVAPAISVEVEESGITVRDNGRGLPTATIESILDFSVRVSSREAYVSPTRGAQGNALKTILAMPFVLDGERGEVEIAARGERHRITFRVDQVQQKPVLTHEVEPADCKTGTEIRVLWPDCACSTLVDAEARFLQIADAFALLNPTLTLDVSWFSRRSSVRATRSTWEKWKPSDPTSAHWYDGDRFERLIGAYLTHDAGTGRVRTVREFVSEFRGLSGSAKGKAVLAAVGLSREPLGCLVTGDRIDRSLSGRLLEAMQENSNPVKPVHLGTIGREHFEIRFADKGCEMGSFEYKKIAECDDDGRPFVIEAAFAWLGQSADERDEETDVDDSDEEDEDLGDSYGRPARKRPTRQTITGVNWSPGIRNPFRTLGADGPSLDSILAEQEITATEPVIFVLHLAYPAVNYLDRGKSSIALPSSIASALVDAVKTATWKWAKQRKREKRDLRARWNRLNVMARQRTVSVKAAAWEIMEEAYLKASANDTLPAKARQIMYAARPYIQATATNDLSAGFDNYFSQTLLPDYVEKQGVDWNVVYDARGHFQEPHTRHKVPLGTLEVRTYLNSIRGYAAPAISVKLSNGHFPTFGPQHRYGGVMFVEKEGFQALFDAVKLAERYDLAIMSTKGMSVTASRRLAEELCGPHGIPLLLLHDFDKSGFSIAGTLQRDTRRYTFSRSFEVYDLGLRMEDIAGLETERVMHKASDEAVAANLRENGASEEEIRFLLRQRVELNAFTSDQLVAFIERKLAEVGIRKVVPDEVTLQAACHRARTTTLINQELEALVTKASEQAETLPAMPDLAHRVRALLDQEPALSWDAAVAQIVATADQGGGSEVPDR
jgi:hypothetical protein